MTEDIGNNLQACFPPSVYSPWIYLPVAGVDWCTCCPLCARVMVQVVAAMAEARGEPQSVQDRVEEAGVAKVSKRRDSRAVGTPLVPVHAIHRPAWVVGSGG